MGPSGVGKTHLAVAALKESNRRGHAGLFLRLPRTAERNPGQLQPGQRIHGNEHSRSNPHRRNSRPRRSRRKQAFRLGPRHRGYRPERALQRDSRTTIITTNYSIYRRGRRSDPPCPAANSSPGRAKIRSNSESAAECVPASSKCAAPSKCSPPIFAANARKPAAPTLSSRPDLRGSVFEIRSRCTALHASAEPISHATKMASKPSISRTLTPG